MYNIETYFTPEKKTFIFHGPINSTNADEVGQIVFPQITPDDVVEFDFQDVEYLSSAGLRIVLKAGKSAKKFEVINVLPEVYEVFDMTGFTQIVKITRAMRVISIEGKELIGEGYNGRVYRLDPETIIKVYYRNSTLEGVRDEIAKAKAAFVFGIPTAIPFDVVKVKEGGIGSVFELLNSACFNKLFIAHPENTDHYIDLYIKLLKEIMDIRVEGESKFPRKINEAYHWLENLRKLEAFEPRVLDKMEALINTIPADDNHLIHGDFHIKNIMMQGEEPVLIDMDTVGVGHEIFEFVAFFLAYCGYASTDHNNTKEFFGIDYEVCTRIFDRTIEEIFIDKTKEERDAIVDKLALLGYFWLTNKTLKYEPDNKVRLDHSKEEVLRLIDKVDTLYF